MKKDDETSLKDFVNSLDETGHERRAEMHSDSFFDNAPDDATLVTRSREFDDIHKHYVRRQVWLKLVKRVAAANGGNIHLLTLPGKFRFEVGLYQKCGLLKRVPHNGRDCLSVVGFETDPTTFGLLKTSGPPLLEMLLGSILSALTDATSQNGVLIRKHAPFDVINLDLTANIANQHDGPYSPFLQSIRECFQLQGSQSTPWLLMVTFRTGLAETERRVVQTLTDFFQTNLDTHLQFREQCLDAFDVESAATLLERRPHDGVGLFTGKWIVEQGHQFEWECAEFKHATFTRGFSHKDGSQDAYGMSKLCFLFKKRLAPRRQLILRQVPAQSWHADDLARLIKPGNRVDVDSAVANLSESSRARLAAEIEEFKQNQAITA
ncbi:MAG: hypothetical protein R3B09_01805 [Nannocystaceae bacterium]